MRHGGRRAAVALLAVAGVAVVLTGLAELGIGSQRVIARLGEIGTTAQQQQFAFDREVWRALEVDTVFPPNETGSPDASAVSLVAIRIGIGRPATCAAALDPALVQLVAAGCGPVLRADYTDASQTLVATVGVAFLGTTPAQQADIAGATASPHDDLRPRALALPGTAAARFGDAQRLVSRVTAPAGEPFLVFSVTGFADGRPAAADAGGQASTQSGADQFAQDLSAAVSERLDLSTHALWERRPQ